MCTAGTTVLEGWQRWRPVPGEIVRRGAARSGLAWHYNLEYEIDCHSVALERIAS
jgi:hypothetical protein